jgi:type VI secretion system secreted protein Hcp
MMGMKVLLLACMVVLVTAVSASAAPEFYVSVIGSLQGPFKGELQGKGAMDGKFAGVSFDYGAISPRDAATGLASGKRQHKPVRIQKVWGPASVQFYAAMVKNELLTVTMDFLTPSMTGEMVLDHTVKLTGATLSSFSSRSELGQYPVPPVTDTIELVFQKIELIDHKGKSAVMDSWTAP